MGCLCLFQEFESCFLLTAVTFSPCIHPLILSVLSFPFITIETLFWCVYSDQKSQHLLDLCHIWHCHSFSFLATVVVSALRLTSYPLPCPQELSRALSFFSWPSSFLCTWRSPVPPSHLTYGCVCVYPLSPLHLLWILAASEHPHLYSVTLNSHWV